MKGFCRKCNKVTDFEKKSTMLRAGDHGFHKTASWMCKECGYMPLFAPREEPEFSPKEEK